MKEFKSQKIKSVIKVLLKKKGLTYEDLSQELECSVPTIKRILGREELTLNRLLQFCEIVGTDLAELEKLTKENSIKEEKFTEEQEAFLAKNQNYFAYLMKLFMEQTPLEIAQKFNLNSRSTDKYLIGLEKLDLIRVTGRQKVKPAFKNIPTFCNGPLAKKYFQSFISSAAHFFIGIVTEGLNTPKGEKSKSPGNFSVMTISKISEENYKEWLIEQEKLFVEMVKKAQFEEKTRDPKDLKSAVVVRAHAIVTDDHEGLKKLENAVGEIINI
jgi:transcriptional regulator with XRE-family HTH domain